MGEVVLLTIPFGEVSMIKSGKRTGPWTAAQLPEARIVRAFNSVHAKTFKTEAKRKETQSATHDAFKSCLKMTLNCATHSLTSGA